MSTEFLRSKHDRQQILNTFYGRPLSLLFFFYICGYRYFGNGGTDRREILHDGTYRFRTQSLRSWGRYSEGEPQIPKFWA